MSEDTKKLENMIENLAVSMVNGFSSIDKRFNNVEADIKSLKTENLEHLNKIDGKLEEINENVEAIIKDYHPRIEGLEEKVLG